MTSTWSPAVSTLTTEPGGCLLSILIILIIVIIIIIIVIIVIRWLLPHAEDGEEKEEDFGTSSCASTQRHLWNLFENPHHSRAAKVTILSSASMVPDEDCILFYSILLVLSCLVVVGWCSKSDNYYIRAVSGAGTRT